MIREVEWLCKKLSEFYSPVTLFDGAIGDYVGLGVFVVSAEYTGSAGQGIVDVDFQINMRSRNVSIAYTIVGFLARYPGVIGPITFDKGPPVADLGASEVALGATLHCDLVYPSGYIELPGDTDRLTITYVYGEEVLRWTQNMPGPDDVPLHEVVARVDYGKPYLLLEAADAGETTASRVAVTVR